MKSLLAISIGALLSLAAAPPVTAPQGPAALFASTSASALEDAADPQVIANDDDGIAPAVFATIDITIDPMGQPLGAYQFEIASPDASFKVLGIEGGFHTAFDDGRPPYYDRSADALDTNRLIVAQYAQPQLGADALPTQAVHVVTLHVVFDRPIDAAHPAVQLTLTAAGDAQGNPIDDAQISYAFPDAE